jgi:large subunit ribosomal protein L3
MLGIIGRKKGMTQMYKDGGKLCPATVIEVGPCPVLQVKGKEGKDGYNALKIGFWESEKVSLPQKGVCAKAKVAPQKVFHEFRVDNVAEYDVGSLLKADVFEVGETVMVRGTTKGRGFAGVLKRHNFKGGDDTHGCRSNRIPGSIGGSSDPSRVFKGKKMPGHYGNTAQTVKGLEVLLVDPDQNVILVKGAVPGPKNGIVYVTKQK